MKIRFFLLFFSLYFLCFGQNLKTKKEELEKIKAEIVKQEEHIKKLESERKKAEKNLSQQKKNKKETENKIKKLRKEESEAKEKLNLTKSNLTSTENQLEFLQQLRDDELNRLCYAHYEKMLFPEKDKDAYLLSRLICNTNREIQNYSSKKNQLIQKKTKESKQFENLQWSRIVNTKKSKKLNKKISSISNTITEKDKEREKAIQKKEQLEKDAQALDDLITKLQSSISDIDYSYKFSTPKLIWPVKGKVLQAFGEQKNSTYNVSTQNNGIDIEAPEGTSVKAVDNGVVAFAEWYQGAGKLIIIDHQNGFFTLYSHNQTLLVSKGDKVSREQKIALSGKTGSTEKACLHFEIRKRGNPVNPLHYLE